MKNFRLSVIGLAAIGLVASGFVVTQDLKRERGKETDAAKEALEGKAAPAFEIADWANTESCDIKPANVRTGLSVSDLKGKVVLIDFWAYWCGPCKASMPHLRELQEKNRDRGLIIVSVHSDKGYDKMQDAIKENNMNWLVAYDPLRTMMKTYQGDSYPDYYLIDRNGVLRYADLANAEVDKAVELLLNEK